MSFTDSVTDVVAINANGLLAVHPSWERVRLGDVFVVQNGFPFDSSRFNTSGAGFPLLRIRDIVHGSTKTFYDGPFDESYLVQPGDVVVGMDGDFNVRRWRGAPALLNQRVCRLLPRGGYPQGLLPIVLQGYLDAINARTPSITVKHLSSKTIADIPLPLPPAGEQTRLFDAIDEYLSRLDAAALNLERVQKKLKAYRASVLRAAVEGRLVPTEAELARKEGREYEPASILIARILAERRRRWEEAELARLKKAGKPPKDHAWKARYVEPTPPDMSGLPELPEGWCWATVEQLGVIASGQTPNGVTEMCSPKGDIPWFRVGDMNTPGNDVHMVHGKDFLTTDQVESLGLHVRPAGTIIFPKRGGAIATNKKRLLQRPSTYDLNTMGVMPVPEAADYLWVWFLKLDLGGLSDGSNVPQLNNGNIAPLPVPLPPATEQARIIETVELLLSSSQKSAEQVSVNHRRCGRLRQAVLKWAFEGKLVDQDPNDEPAETLLARIRADRAATPSPKASSGRKAKK